MAAIIGLSLNVGAYASEIIRGGIISIPKGQTEAAYSIGMTYGQNDTTYHFTAGNSSVDSCTR